MFAFAGSSCWFSPLLLLVFLPRTHSAQDDEAQLIERAQALIAAGQLSDVDQILERAIRLYPRSGGLYNLIGIAAAERNRNPEAESAFRQAVKYSPALVPAYLNLARVQYGEGEQTAATATYRRALRLDSSLEEAHANLGALLLSKGSFVDAEREFAALPKTLREQNRFRAMECAALAGSGQMSHAKAIANEMRGSLVEQDVSLSAFTLAKIGQSVLVIQMIEPVLKNGASKELRGLLATAYAQTDKLTEARVIRVKYFSRSRSTIIPFFLSEYRRSRAVGM